MKQLTYNITGRQFLLLCVSILAIFYLPQVMAASNPLEGISVTPGGKTNDLSANMFFWIRFVIVALTFVVLFIGMSQSILSVFNSLRQARRDGEWGDFFVNLLLIFIGLGFAIFVGYIEFQLLDKFQEYWKSSSTP